MHFPLSYGLFLLLSFLSLCLCVLVGSNLIDPLLPLLSRPASFIVNLFWLQKRKTLSSNEPEEIKGLNVQMFLEETENSLGAAGALRLDALSS